MLLSIEFEESSKSKFRFLLLLLFAASCTLIAVWRLHIGVYSWTLSNSIIKFIYLKPTKEKIKFVPLLSLSPLTVFGALSIQQSWSIEGYLIRLLSFSFDILESISILRLHKTLEKIIFGKLWCMNHQLNYRGFMNLNLIKFLLIIISIKIFINIFNVFLI